ncbi:MAG: fimbria/pilus periplasmic chaperone [Alphaproteobacteria bacterium]|jgi:P pilus assembly chaperone PapD|nr:fimbria/pilus periplasmic chaperone [Alphaproteobacteria bacterium]
MNKRHALGAAFMCAMTLTSLPSLAQIAPDGVQRYFRSGERPIQNVKVSNRYPKKDFNVTVKIQQEFNKNMPDARTEDTSDFLMAPNVFPLRAQENRLIRLVYTKPLDNEEKVYRVTFHPKAIEIIDNEVTDKIAFGLDLLQTTGMLVLVSPKNPSPKFRWERDETGITIINEGNTSVDFMRVKDFCESGKPKDPECKLLLPGRVYPGQTRKFDYPGNLPIKEWYYRIYDQIQPPISISAYNQ